MWTRAKVIAAVLGAVLTLAAALPAMPAAAAGTDTVVFGLPSAINAGDSATIYGEVVDSTGQPTVGQAVYVVASSGTVDGAVYTTTTTDALGDWSVSYQAPSTSGTDTITASVPGDTGSATVQVEPTGTIPAGAVEPPASNVTVSAPQVSATSLDAGQTVAETTTVTAGGQAVSVPATIYVAPPNGGQGLWVGPYALAGSSFVPLDPGAWGMGAQVMDGQENILATSQGLTTVNVTGTATEHLAISAPASVTPGGIVSVSGTLSAASSSGRTYPIGDASLQVAASGASGPTYATTDASGAFDVNVTAGAAGTATITVTEPTTGTQASATIRVAARKAPAPPPPAPCVQTSALPADFLLVGCVATGSGGQLSIPIPSTVQGTMMVYALTEARGMQRYMPTALAPDSATITAGVGTYAVLDSTRTYTDVAAGTNTTAAIDTITAAGAAAGFADGSFRPSSPATVGQIAQMVSVALGLAPPVPVHPTAGAAWATPYIEALDAALGSHPAVMLSPAMSGDTMTLGTFAALWSAAAHVPGPAVSNPGAPITRAEVAQILAAWIEAQAPAK